MLPVVTVFQRRSMVLVKRCLKRRTVLSVIVVGIVVIVLTGLRLASDSTQDQIKLFEFANYNRTTKWSSFPMILHQTYASELVTKDYEEFIRDCLGLNPEWKYFLWRDEDMIIFVQDHFPWFLSKFRGFKTKIERADAIRYMALYHFGGIYLDMDIHCKQPFFPTLLNASPAFLDQERQDQVQILYGRDVSVMNSAMGSLPRHPFFLQLLHAVMAVPTSENKPDLTTGPGVLTKAYFDWVRTPMQFTCPVALLEPVVFSPMVDDGAYNYVKLCQKILHNSAVEFPKEKRRLIIQGCKTVLLPGWKVDATNRRFTVGRHLFTHLGYHDNRTSGHFDIRNLAPHVQMYKLHRMEPMS